MSGTFRRRVLVVEDNDDHRRVLQILLEDAGYEVESAAEGGQALDLQRRRPVHVVLTDIFMPGREGLETIKALRQEWPALKIIAMSGGGSVSYRDYLGVAQHLGADAILRKPFEPQALLDHLKSVLP